MASMLFIPPRRSSRDWKSWIESPRPRAFVAAPTAFFALLVAGAPAAHATLFSCQSTGGNWTTAGNWSSCNSTFPNNGGGNTYDATITSGTSIQNAAVTVGNVTVSSGVWALTGTSAQATLTGNL